MYIRRNFKGDKYIFQFLEEIVNQFLPVWQRNLFATNIAMCPFIRYHNLIICIQIENWKLRTLR